MSTLAADQDIPDRRLAEGLLWERQVRGMERSLALFIQGTRLPDGSFKGGAWDIVEPQQPLKWNWHLDPLCADLEALGRGDWKDELFNCPPGTSKSNFITVLFPAWLWTRRPELRFLCASHDQVLATRDNQKMRDLVQSGWYQGRWPHVQLKLDQNQKTFYKTTRGGWRIATSIGGRGIGEHPHFKLIDDAHKPPLDGAGLTELERESTWNWVSGTLSTRGIALDPATMVVGQRVDPDDVSARVLTRFQGFRHVALQMRYTVPRPASERSAPQPQYPMPPEWQAADPRTEDGELLWPALLPERAIAKAEQRLGPDGVAAQLQQQPEASGGAMFERGWFGIIDQLPIEDDVEARVRFWDIAGTEEGHGARTAGILMWRLSSGLMVIPCAGIVKGRWEDDAVDRNVKSTARLDGAETAVREEQEPGSSGKAVVKARQRQMPGYDYEGRLSTGDKVTRARPLKSAASAGNVKLLVSPGDKASLQNAMEFLDEVQHFPRAKVKDQVDAAAGAYNELVTTDTGILYY